MKPKIYFLIYLSAAVREFSKEELLEMLASFRKQNAANNITGMLLYKDGYFQQLIEGSEEAVKFLYERICLDERHRGITTLIEGFEEERQFSDWSMGFCDLNSEEAAKIPGYSQFLDTSLSDDRFRSNPDIGRRFMLLFRNHQKSSELNPSA